MDNMSGLAINMSGQSFGETSSDVENIIKSYSTKSCKEYKNGGIALQSMLCSFEIKDIDGNVIYK
jgi:hypothetical protein